MKRSFAIVFAAIIAGVFALSYIAQNYLCNTATGSSTSICQSLNSGNLSFLSGNGTFGKYFAIGAIAAIVALVIWGL